MTKPFHGPLAGQKAVADAFVIAEWKDEGGESESPRYIAKTGEFAKSLRDSAVNQTLAGAEHHVWVAPAGQTVRINGLDFKPDGDAHIVLLAGAPLWRQGSYLVSAKASIWMGDIQLQGAQTIRRQIDRNVEQYPLATFHFNSPRNFIPGFPLIGDITASFARKKPYQTLMLARLKLPSRNVG